MTEASVTRKPVSRDAIKLAVATVILMLGFGVMGSLVTLLALGYLT